MIPRSSTRSFWPACSGRNAWTCAAVVNTRGPGDAASAPHELLAENKPIHAATHHPAKRGRDQEFELNMKPFIPEQFSIGQSISEALGRDQRRAGSQRPPVKPEA